MRNVELKEQEKKDIHQTTNEDNNVYGHQRPEKDTVTW